MAKKPAKDSIDSIVAAIVEKTYIIKCENVTIQDDLVSQRHEQIGTEKIYNNLAENGVSIHVHMDTHDRNPSVNKFVKDLQANQRKNGKKNQLDQHILKAKLGQKICMTKLILLRLIVIGH